VRPPAAGTGGPALARRISLFLILAFALSFLLNAPRLENLPLICLWRGLFGLPCPFCGLTRSVSEISHGRLTAALGYHPFGPLVYAAGIILLFLSLRAWLRGRSLALPARYARTLRALLLLTGAAWLAWWLYRTASLLGLLR
jgi:hypothetical protein